MKFLLDNSLISLTAMAGIIGAVAAYLAKKYVDLKFQSIQNRHVKKTEAIYVIRGLLSEITHCIDKHHLGDEEQGPFVREHCLAARRASRENIGALGQEYVDAVKNATQMAYAFVETKSPEDFENWQSSYALTESYSKRLAMNILK